MKITRYGVCCGTVVITAGLLGCIWSRNELLWTRITWTGVLLTFAIMILGLLTEFESY